jgi:hypothetical protein
MMKRSEGQGQRWGILRAGSRKNNPLVLHLTEWAPKMEISIDKNTKIMHKNYCFKMYYKSVWTCNTS